MISARAGLSSKHEERFLAGSFPAADQQHRLARMVRTGLLLPTAGNREPRTTAAVTRSNTTFTERVRAAEGMRRRAKESVMMKQHRRRLYLRRAVRLPLLLFAFQRPGAEHGAPQLVGVFRCRVGRLSLLLFPWNNVVTPFLVARQPVLVAQGR